MCCRLPHKLNAFEILGLGVPGNLGFTLKCVLRAVDPGPDAVIFTFPFVRTFNNPLDILDAEDIFTSNVSEEILDEDANRPDEIRARFTLMNNSNGQRVTRETAIVQIVL